MKRQQWPFELFTWEVAVQEPTKVVKAFDHFFYLIDQIHLEEVH